MGRKTAARILIIGAQQYTSVLQSKVVQRHLPRQPVKLERPHPALPGACAQTPHFQGLSSALRLFCLLEPEGSPKIGEVTLMRPFHGNL